MNKPYWQAAARPRFAKISGKSAAFDAVVIGGGITGLAAAYFLKKAGKKVCLLERDRLGGGDTGRTTAHLNSFIDLRMTELVEAFGEDKAHLVVDGGAAAIDAIERMVREHEISCGFRRVPGFLHAPLLARSAAKADVKSLRDDAAWAQKLGMVAAFVESMPVTGKPAVRFADQALFHPLRFLAGLAAVVTGGGCEIHEHSEVTKIEGEPFVVSGNGFSIRCEQVVIATHVPLQGVTNTASAAIFQTKIAPYSSYVIGAKAPRGSLPELSASDTSDPYYYWRVDRAARHDYIILGGRDHKTGQVKDTAPRFAQLAKALAKLAPDAVVDHRWSGQVVETHDGLPFIGELSKGQFIATGFTGNGMTFGVLAGMMAKDAAKNPWRELFSPNRAEVRAGGLRAYFRENIDYPRYMAKSFLTPPPAGSPRAVKRGEGCVLKIDGARVACARDDSGKLHKVSAICTHMGCVVQWNKGEQTWDCPCHGSRFQIDGKVIGGPAEQPLAKHP